MLRVVCRCTSLSHQSKMFIQYYRGIYPFDIVPPVCSVIVVGNIKQAHYCCYVCLVMMVNSSPVFSRHKFSCETRVILITLRRSILYTIIITFKYLFYPKTILFYMLYNVYSIINIICKLAEVELHQLILI